VRHNRRHDDSPARPAPRARNDDTHVAGRDSVLLTMIARHWRGVAHPGRARGYEEHLRAETFPSLKRIPGFVDASILRRTIDSGVEFLIVTRWQSMDAIRQFAGADPEAAVVPPAVEAMMVDYDRRVTHYEVVTM
jgi:heme-degrading monooxygenase HmoA